MEERPSRPSSVPMFNTKNCDISNSIVSAPPSVRTNEIVFKENGQEIEQNKVGGGEEEQQLVDGGNTHSIYGTDPKTKKRFYEPHKRPGCTEEYCLSRVTQVGERICNIENKLIQLEELFVELINKRKTNSNEQLQTNQNGQMNIHQLSMPNIVSSSILANNQVNENQIRPTMFRQPGPRYTGPCLFSRLVAPSTRIPHSTFGNAAHLDLIRPTPPTLNLTSTRKSKTNAGSQSQIAYEKQNFPVPIPYKPLRYNVRVYFLDEQRRTPNHCRICFAIFSDQSPNPFIQKDPIPAAHLQRHLTPVLETYLCSICAKGGVAFKIHFLSLPAVVQHLLNQHGISGSEGIQKGYTKAENSKNTTNELRAFISEQMGVKSTGAGIIPKGDNGKHSTNDEKWKLMSKEQLASGLFKNGENTKKQPPVVTNSNNATKKIAKKKYSDEPTFNLSGDCLDKLLECQLPCTLTERVNRLKNIERTPVNHLIVNIGQNVLAEKDFNLANIIAKHEHEDLKNSFGDNSTTKGRRKKSASILSSQSTTRQSRSQSRISSIVVSIAKGNRKRRHRNGTNEESGEEQHSDDESHSSVFEEETADGSEESEDSDYKPNGKNAKKKKKGMKPIMEEQQNAQTSSLPSTSTSSMAKELYQLPGGNSTLIPSYRVHLPEASTSNANKITPSSALMQEFGYVASKGGIYGNEEEEDELEEMDE